jgi:hypothetical protein
MLVDMQRTKQHRVPLELNRILNQEIYNLKNGPKMFEIHDQKEIRSDLHSGSSLIIQRRESLVQTVIEKGLPLSKAARRFNIKLSTAKLILKRFKETGRFFPKKCKKMGLDDI